MSDHTPPAAPASAPLILTALLDRHSFSVLDDLRRRFFPAALNRVQAHVTLFHHLPGDELRAISARVATVAGTLSPLAFRVTSTRFLGRGVAFDLSCPALTGLRVELARSWNGNLTAQDRQGYRPHVTIQNKVTAPEARVAQRHLETLLPSRDRSRACSSGATGAAPGRRPAGSPSPARSDHLRPASPF